jgi:integrase
MPTSRLFDERGRRLFFNHEERKAFLKAAVKATDTTRTFCSLLHYTGCSLTEGLTLTPSQVDFSARTVILEGTTPRRHDITRAIPVPDSFIAFSMRCMTSAALNPVRMPISLFGRKTERRWSRG